MDTFLEACGASESLRLEIEGPRAGRVRTRMLVHPFALLGRAPASDIPLRHAQVSLRHAYLQLIQGRLACFDLGGRGGIQWADGRPARAGWLDPDQSIGIGPYRINRVASGSVLAAGNPPAQSRAIRSADKARHSAFGVMGAINPMNARWDGPGPDVVLEFPDQGSGALSRWRMSRLVTLVGRAPGCRIRLPDVNVSWHHCSLVRTPGGLWVVDLMSRVGVLVNGAALRYGRLDDGDELHVGPFRIIVRMVSRETYRASSGRAHRAAPIAPVVSAPMPTPVTVLAVPNPTTTALADPFEADLAEILNSQRGSPALVMLVEQFGRMQQNMLEQFNQSLMMLMQHMGDQYREQMRQVRGEMDELRRLTDELIGMKERVRDNAMTAMTTITTTAAASLPELPKPQGDLSEKLPPPIPVPVDDPLVMVSRRISEIRGEQRSRWQRIMDLVKSG